MKRLFSFPWGDVVIQYISSHTEAQTGGQPATPPRLKKRRSEKQRAVSREFFSRAEARRAEARLNREKLLQAIYQDPPQTNSPLRGGK